MNRYLTFEVSLDYFPENIEYKKGQSQAGSLLKFIFCSTVFIQKCQHLANYFNLTKKNFSGAHVPANT
jgi:hypothetical protein